MRESVWEFGNLDGNAGNVRNQGRSQGISRNQWENVGNQGGDAGNQGGKLGTAVEMKQNSSGNDKFKKWREVKIIENEHNL